ncbi:DoxX family protein [Glycomyces albidus]|uniref:DoxX family protein n=1 Tax=Glycomyces albidus TaxID=2656774 RepID=A0A6L5G9J6_9ACTN|nr:DoxX family protein [Glycomyces albidus]MQM26345.1 DoxX family protein [Glycomyces albidus]
MDIALWVTAGLLALVLLGGTAKLFLPNAKIVAMGAKSDQLAWVTDFPPGALKAIGLLELLGVIGLLLPGALGIAPVLVPIAASGAVALFTGAVIMRVRRGERGTVTVNVIYLAMALFVAVGRFVFVPFPG